MQKAILSLLFIAVAAVAADKPAPQYQDAVLVNFRTVQSGTSCASSGQVNGNVDDSGNVTGQTYSRSNCSANWRAYYTIALGDHTYTLTPSDTKKRAAASIASFGYADMFRKSSDLYHKMPGTRVLVRSDNNAVYVKVGKRESRYEVVEAR